jgi:hypothetical protein
MERRVPYRLQQVLMYSYTMYSTVVGVVPIWNDVATLHLGLDKSDNLSTTVLVLVVEDIVLPVGGVQ